MASLRRSATKDLNSPSMPERLASPSSSMAAASSSAAWSVEQAFGHKPFLFTAKRRRQAFRAMCVDQATAECPVAFIVKLFHDGKSIAPIRGVKMDHSRGVSRRWKPIIDLLLHVRARFSWLARAQFDQEINSGLARSRARRSRSSE